MSDQVLPVSVLFKLLIYQPTVDSFEITVDSSHFIFGAIHIRNVSYPINLLVFFIFHRMR